MPFFCWIATCNPRGSFLVRTQKRKIISFHIFSGGSDRTPEGASWTGCEPGGKHGKWFEKCNLRVRKVHCILFGNGVFWKQNRFFFLFFLKGVCDDKGKYFKSHYQICNSLHSGAGDPESVSAAGCGSGAFPHRFFRLSEFCLQVVS